MTYVARGDLRIRELPKLGRALPGALPAPVLKGNALPGAKGSTRSRGTSRRRASARSKSLFSGVRGGSTSTAPKAGKKKTSASKGVVVASKPSKSGTSKAQGAAERITTAVVKQAVASTIGRKLSRRAKAAQTRRLTTAIKEGLAKAATKGGALVKTHGKTAAKYSGVAAAGVAAYGITRKSKLGGKVGDYVVAKVAARHDAKADARLRAFRAAVAAERRRGPVSSDRVRQLAAQYGPF